MDHKFSKNSKYYTIVIYGLAFVILAAVAIKLVWHWDATSSYLGRVLGVVQPFLIGLLIAYLINPLTKLINEKIFRKIFKNKAPKTRKILSVLTSYIIVIGVIVTALFYIIPQIVDSLMQIANLVESAQTGYSSIMNKLNKMKENYPEWNIDAVIKTVDGIPAMMTDVITKTVPKLIPTLYNTSISLISGVINLLIAIMVSIYMLLDKAQLINNGKRIVYAILKPEKADRFLETAAEFNKIFGNFIIGKMIDSIIIGILCWIIMTIIGLPYALVISVIVGITNMIPYFGPFIGAVPGVLLLIIANFGYAVIFTILIIALQQFDGLYLGPKILGESTGLRPIWIIFAITVGGWAAGVAGMFLGVPVVAVIAHLTNRALDKKIVKKEVSFDYDEETGIMRRHVEATSVKKTEACDE